MRSNQAFLFVFIVGVIIAAVFVWPAWQNVANLTQEELSSKEALKSAQASVAQMGEVSANLETMKEELSKLSLSIPLDPEIPELMVQFEDIAKRHGLVIGGAKFSTGDKSGTLQAGGVGAVKIEFSLEGAYQGFFGFVKDVENNARLMDALSISFVPSQADPSLIKYSVIINSYYLMAK